MFTIAFGITRAELDAWKKEIERGEIAFLTHYWLDPRFPNSDTVTKVGCRDLDKLSQWCIEHQLDPNYIHKRDRYPHFDLIGPYQYRILKQLGLDEHITRFKLSNKW